MNICVFLSSADLDDRYTRPACEFAELVGKGGHTLVWGGSDAGLMKVASLLVRDSVGKAAPYVERPCEFHQRIATTAYVVDQHILLAAVQARTAGPEQHGWNAGRAENRGVGPERHTDASGGTADSGRRMNQRVRQRTGRIDLVRLTAENHFCVRLELRIFLAKLVENRHDFGQSYIRRFSRQRPALELQ